MGTASTALKMFLRPKRACGTEFVPMYEREFAHTIVGKDLPTLAFNRGRVALWAILKAASVDERSEVILPAYTCETVPMAVKFAGAKCVYADVEPGHYNVPLEHVKKLLTSCSKVVICQHTYGITQPVRDWAGFVSENGILLVEDRCQMAADMSDGRSTSIAGDAAYFSTHFSKPFSTGQGGLVVFSNNQMYPAVEQVRAEFPLNGDRKRVHRLAFQVLLYTLTVRPLTRAVIGNVFRWAQRCGLIRGTISVDEYGEQMPSDYLSRSSNFQASLGIEQLHRWRENCRHRRCLTKLYMERLASLGIDVNAFRQGDEEPILLMVPVLVNNKEEMLKRASKRSLPIGTWFDRSPAHINPDSAHLYDYRPGQCPQTERLISKEIHLLTASWVTEYHAEKAVEFIRRYAEISNPQD
jgi:perosamine synthetase